MAVFEPPKDIGWLQKLNKEFVRTYDETFMKKEPKLETRQDKTIYQIWDFLPSFSNWIPLNFK